MRTHTHFILTASLLVASLTSAPALAEQARAPSLALAFKAGGSLPSLFSGLENTLGGELEVGLLLFGGQLELAAAAGYSQPPASHSGSDPRLAGGSFSWSLRQDLLSVGLLGRYRFLSPGSAFNVYVSAGPRLYLLRTQVTGGTDSAGFGESTQTASELGLAAALGAELGAGPGRVLLEVGLGAAPLQGLLTGQSAASALELTVGYRLLF